MKRIDSSVSLGETRQSLITSNQTIRTLCRDSRYWGYGDRMAETWLGFMPLNEAVALHAAVSINAAIDSIYENCTADDAASLQGLSDRLSRKGVGAGEYPPLPALCDHGLVSAVIEATEAIEVLGCAELAQWCNEDTSEAWRNLWRNSVEWLVAAQVAAAKMGFGEGRGRCKPSAPEASLQTQIPAEKFSAGVEEYITKHGATTGAACTVAAILPFAASHMSSEISATIRALQADDRLFIWLDRLLRLAADVKPNLSEAVNTGVAGIAFAYGLDAEGASAKCKLIEGDLELLLKGEWLKWRGRAGAELEDTLASYPNIRTLRDIGYNGLFVADIIASALDGVGEAQPIP